MGKLLFFNSFIKLMDQGKILFTVILACSIIFSCSVIRDHPIQVPVSGAEQYIIVLKMKNDDSIIQAAHNTCGNVFHTMSG